MKATILLVEDNPDVREMMATALQLEGHAVVPAANGREALARLRSGLRPSVIILDLMMPVMDGWAFRTDMQQDPALADIPVVVVSAVGAELLHTMPASAYVPKPVDIDRLLEVVCETCHGPSHMG